MSAQSALGAKINVSGAVTVHLYVNNVKIIREKVTEIYGKYGLVATKKNKKMFGRPHAYRHRERT